MNRAGFTIIETMLFLAVTGLLVAGMIGGTGNSLKTQRYKDSVSSLESKIKEQYSNINNVDNEHDTSWSCDVNGITKNVADGTYRGQSNCVIIGKLITYNGSLKNAFNISTVTGVAPGVEGSALNDVDIFNATGYNIKASRLADFTEEYSLEWGSALVDDDNRPSAFSVLIVRSPVSGIIKTFVDPTTAVDANKVKDLVDDKFLKNDMSVNVCIATDGNFIPRMALLIPAGSSSGNSIETLGNVGNNKCQ